MADATRSRSAVSLKAITTLLFSSVYLDRSSPARVPLPSSRSIDESETQRRRRRGRYVRFRRALTCGLVAALIESHQVSVERHKNDRRRQRQHRRQVQHQRVDTEFWNTVTSSWDESTWIANFRVSRRTFRLLCASIKHLIEGHAEPRRSGAVDVRAPVAKCVALALWRLATNIDYDTLSWLFGVSKTTALAIVRRVCKAVVTSLMPRFVNIPRDEALQEITKGFQEINALPNVCGVIGICHIPVVAARPTSKTGDDQSEYGSSGAFTDHLMAMQAVVDYRGIFMDCSIGWPGRMHPADILNNSPLYEKGESGHLFVGLPTVSVETANGDYNIPGYILGDLVHPLLDWMVKPFVGQHLQIKQQEFNVRVSEVRNVFEQAFRRLNGRWLCLSRRLDVDTSDAPLFIATCVTLHNLCEIQGEVFNNSAEFMYLQSTDHHHHHQQSGTPSLMVVASDDCKDERSSYVTLRGEELRSVLCDFPPSTVL